MPVVAFVPSLWAATLRTLRELTRVAVTTLALVVGLTGPAAATEPVRPDATHRPAAGLSAVVPPVDGPAPDAFVDAGPVATAAWAVGTRPAAAPHSPAGHPLAAATPPAPGRAAGLVDGETAVPRTDVAAADPAREPVARRGPPRA